jgi:hypothetical protein
MVLFHATIDRDQCAYLQPDLEKEVTHSAILEREVTDGQFDFPVAAPNTSSTRIDGQRHEEVWG